jgi:hypothetical protein
MIKQEGSTKNTNQFSDPNGQPQTSNPIPNKEESGMNKTYHDFRSSLNIIIGYSELMLDGVMGKMTDEQRDGIKDILTSSFHLLDLVNKVSGRQPAIRS